MTPRSWARPDGVDVLRGLAIFFVLMIHVNMSLLIAEVPHTKGLPDQLVYTGRSTWTKGADEDIVYRHVAAVLRIRCHRGCTCQTGGCVADRDASHTGQADAIVRSDETGRSHYRPPRWCAV